MKRILLGTTAILATGSFAVPASAADNTVKLGFGGRYLGAAGYVISQDSDDEFVEDSRDHVFKQDIEVHFQGEGVLDNGLTVGARIELEGQHQDGDQIDESFAFISGGFGELRFGDTPEASYQLCYLVPSASSMFGADSPDFNFSNAGVNGYASTNGTCYGIDDKATKVVYFTPELGGFRFAVSYAPDDTEDTRNTTGPGFATRNDNNLGQFSETVSVAGQYVADWNGFNIALGGGYAAANDAELPLGTDDGNDDAYEINAYAQVGFAGFTVGGALRYRDFDLETIDVQGQNQVYGVGVTYNFDPWTVGLGWTHGDYELEDTDDDDDEHDDIVATGSYALGPGVAIDAMAEYSNYDGDDSEDYEGWATGLGLVIRF
jgi:outer membrane protein OmpU